MEAVNLTRADLDDISRHLDAIATHIPLHPIKTKRDYKAATIALNTLLDSGGANENAPLAALVTLLGDLIADYEEKQSPAVSVSPAAMLRFLMDQHGFKQSDLPEIGSQGVVSEILSGKRDLNVRQIKLLADRFNVGAQAFV